MRVTGGMLRNKNILMKAPKGIRPTASRVREALFSMLGQDLSEMTFLDAFGGSGIIGIEAYSRGATVTISEQRRGAFLSISKLVASEGWSINVVCGNAMTQLEKKWDLIFMDPPYDYDPLPWLEQACSSVLDTLVFEHASTTSMPDHVGELIKTKARQYGDCSLSFYEIAKN